MGAFDHPELRVNTKTKRAMLGMSIDSATAERLIRKAINVKSLKTLSETAPRELGRPLK